MKWLLAFSAIAAAAPATATVDERAEMTVAPTGTAATRYCMRIEYITGSRVEKVRCWTREQWARQGVDVDRDWPEEGIRTIG